MITLSYQATTIELDADLLWADELSWSPVQQSVDRAVTGALIIQVDGDADLPGRPITLRPEDDASAWMPRALVDQLQSWAAIPLATFTLTLRGRARSVMFRHHERPALEAVPVVHFSDVLTTDDYRVTMKFMEI